MIVRTIVLIIAAALLTVVVAWCCAVYLEAELGVQDFTWDQVNCDGTTCTSFAMSRFDRLGRHRYLVDAITPSDQESGNWEPVAPERFLPSWVVPHLCALDSTTGEWGPREPTCFLQVDVSGFPLPCLWSFESTGLDAVVDERSRGFVPPWPVPWYDPAVRLADPVVPFGVRPMAFALNTAVYALLLGAVWRWARVERRLRRFRRGRCPRCGFDLRHDYSRGCTECGWGRPRGAPIRTDALQPASAES